MYIQMASHLDGAQGRAWHRERGLLETLPPKGTRRFSLEIGVVEGAALVEMLQACNARI